MSAFSNLAESVCLALTVIVLAAAIGSGIYFFFLGIMRGKPYVPPKIVKDPDVNVQQ